MYPVKESLIKTKETLAEGVKLVAVSKFHPKEYIEEAYALGQRLWRKSRTRVKNQTYRTARRHPMALHWTPTDQQGQSYRTLCFYD